MNVLRRSRVLLAVVAALVALLGLAALVTGGGGGDDARSGFRLVPQPPPATPGPDLAWWAPVHGEPLGVAVDGSDVAAAALD